VAVKNLTDSSTEMLKVMSTQEFWADQTIIEPYKEKLGVHGQEAKKSQDYLKEQMKFELNEI
jgi:hypothetical protein